MRKWMRNIKLIIAVSTMLAMFAVAPVVYGGITWSGIDPVIFINGQKFNVRVEWPSAFDCSISGPINITVTTPRKALVEFISESVDEFSGCLVETNTEIISSAKGSKTTFEAFVPSAESFEVRLKIDRNGELVAVYEGLSNELVTGDSVGQHGKDLGIDPVLPDDYDESGYNFIEPSSGSDNATSTPDTSTQSTDSTYDLLNTFYGLFYALY